MLLRIVKTTQQTENVTDNMGVFDGIDSVDVESIVSTIFRMLR